MDIIKKIVFAGFCGLYIVSAGKLHAFENVCAELALLASRFPDEFYQDGLSDMRETEGDLFQPVFDQPVLSADDGSGSSVVSEEVMVASPKECGVEPRFGCRVCGACFITRSLQIAHQRETGHNVVQGEVKPFQCMVCGAFFAKHHLLVDHRVIHDVPGRFACAVCGAVFLKQRGLLEHVRRIHTDHEPVIYTCDFPGCNRTFNRRYALNQHRYTHFPHLKPHVCTICAERFVLRSRLRNHMRTQHHVASV